MSHTYSPFYIIAVKGCSFVYLRKCIFCPLSLSVIFIVWKAQLHLRLARSAHTVRRPFGVYIHASSSAHIFEHAQKLPTHTANDDICVALVQRTRRTSNEWWRTPNARQRTGKYCKFSMRGPCVTGPYYIADSSFKIQNEVWIWGSSAFTSHFIYG